MDLKGTIIQIYPKKQVSDNFAKRDFVIETADKYPQKIILQMTQDRCEQLDRVAKGEVITAHINIRGREWTSPQGEVKYFNTLEAWKIENESANNFEPSQGHFENQTNKVTITKDNDYVVTTDKGQTQTLHKATQTLDESDDLPF